MPVPLVRGAAIRSLFRISICLKNSRFGRHRRFSSLNTRELFHLTMSAATTLVIATQPGWLAVWEDRPRNW
jgi:hypothetical protein